MRIWSARELKFCKEGENKNFIHKCVNFQYYSVLLIPFCGDTGTN